MKKPIVGIYTLTWDRLDYTKRCIKAIKEKTHWPYFHFIIDQGSEVETTRYLMRYDKDENVEVLFIGENVGLSKGINLAHQHLFNSGLNYIMKLDNDAEVLDDNWLTRLMAAMLDPDRPKDLVLSPYIRGLVSHKGGIDRGLPQGNPQRFEKYNISYVSHIGGICRLCHRRVLERYGKWDESKPKHYAEDMEFTGRWQDLDWYNGYMEDISILHMDSSLGQQEKYPEYFKRKDHVGYIDPDNFKDYKPDF